MMDAKEALAKRKTQSDGLSPVENMNVLLKSMASQIKMALPSHLSSERFQRIALTAFSGNAKLQSCDPVSFLAAMMQSAQLGLEPNTPLGHAYLIPYKNQVSFQLGYKGLIDLAMRSGAYQSIYAHSVYEEDEFNIDYGLEQSLVHKPKLTGSRGNIVGYYGVYKLVNGGYGFAYMTRKEVEDHGRKFSKTYNNGPWKTDFDAMARKTVIKQALKYAPVSIEIQKATSIDEKVASKENAKTAFENNVIESSFVEMKTEVEEIEKSDAVVEDNHFLGKDFEPIENFE